MAASSRRPPSYPDTHPTTINQRRFRKSRSRPMKTLSSLPPEIVRQIVGEVDLIVAQERSGLGMLSSMGFFPPDVSLDDVIDAGPAAFFGMLAGFLGTGAGDNPVGANGAAPGAAPGAGPNAAPAAPATNTNATTTPTTAATTPAASTAATNPNRSNAPAASTSTVPSTSRQANANPTASNRTGTTASAAPSTSPSASTSRTSANPSSSTAARAPDGGRSGSQPSTNTNRGNANADDITITRPYSLSRDSFSGEGVTDQENEPCTCPSCYFERMLASPGFENEGIDLNDPTALRGPTRGYDDDADPAHQPSVSEDDYDSEFDYDQDGDDDEYDEDEYDDDDNDGSDSDVTDSDPSYYGPPRPYSNGLPLDPLVPLLFVNRTFLHASRAKLYCKITITGAWHGSLLLRSLQAPEHAARTAIEDFDELPKNYLPTYVRHINFNAKGDVSLARGGGQIIVDILKLCTRLQSLTIAPTFLAHARRPLLKALRGLKELKQLSLSSSNDIDVPMLFTTPRISHLMNTAWRELEELTVHGLRSSLDGTIDEEHCMWTELGQNFGMEDAKEHAAVSMACRAANLATNVEALREKLRRHLPEGPKPKGLTALKLTHPVAPATEWSHILQYSSDTLKILDIVHPFASVTPQGLTSTLLTFGVNLTHLSIDVESTWIAETRNSSLLTRDEPRRTSGKGPPPRPKDYVNGCPTAQVVNGIAKYQFLLDAIVPYLRNLKNLSWTGKLASPPMFLSFPPSLSVLAWSQCSSIQPGRLTRILKRRLSRSRNDADGLQGLSAQVAPGLTCISVTDDDVDWDADETDLLDAELRERNVCLHLSSLGPTMARGRGGGAGAGARGANGAFVGFGLGGGGNANRNGGGAAGAAPPAAANAAPGGAAVAAAAAAPQPLAGAGGAAGATTDAGARRVRPRTNVPTTITTAAATAATTTANGTGAGAGTATVTGTGTATNTNGFPPRQAPQNPALGNFTPVSGVGTTGTGLRVAPLSMPRNGNGNRTPNSTTTTATTATLFPPDFFRFNPHLPAATAAGLGSTTSTAPTTTSTSTASTSAASTSTAPIFGASASTSTPGQPVFRFQF